MAKDSFTLGFGTTTATGSALSPDDLADLRQGLHSQGLLPTGTFGPRDAETGNVGDFAMTVTPVVATAVMGFAGAWVQAKFGRKVRVKTEAYEIEAGSTDELIRIFEMVQDKSKQDPST